MDQNNYVNSLKPVWLCTKWTSQKDEVLTIKDKSKLRSIGGQLLGVTSQTRPDALFDSGRVSSYVEKIPRWSSMAECKWWFVGYKF